MHFVCWMTGFMCDLVDVFGFEAFFYTRVYFLLGDYLWALLGGEVCVLINYLSMVLYFKCIVWCGYTFTWDHVCVCVVGILIMSLCGSSP